MRAYASMPTSFLFFIQELLDSDVKLLTKPLVWVVNGSLTVSRIFF